MHQRTYVCVIKPSFRANLILRLNDAIYREDAAFGRAYEIRLWFMYDDTLQPSGQIGTGRCCGWDGWVSARPNLCVIGANRDIFLQGGLVRVRITIDTRTGTKDWHLSILHAYWVLDPTQGTDRATSKADQFGGTLPRHLGHKVCALPLKPISRHISGKNPVLEFSSFTTN